MMNDFMITPKQALEKILSCKLMPGCEEIPLEAALGKILFADVISPVSHPLFNQSAVDGYAVRFADAGTGISLAVKGEIRAGDVSAMSLRGGGAIRIFTGAAVPEGADTVVMQEHAESNGSAVVIRDPKLRQGANIREKGEQIKKGEVALCKGTMLHASAIGFFASLGVSSVTVSRIPHASVIVTGNEFISAKRQMSSEQLVGDMLHKGEIFESNGKMLCAALRAMGIHPSARGARTCPDDLQQLTRTVADETVKCDVLLITGGVSVGDYDYTKTALEKNGYEIIFHGVRQKPGKPFLFSRKGEKAAFGIPGNPRSAMICFYVYVYPYLRASQGCTSPGMTLLHLPLTGDYRKKADDKVHYLAARVTADGVEILEKQGSHMLGSLACANALAVLPENCTNVAKGQPIEVYLLP